MKIEILIVLLISISCKENIPSVIPSFESNSTLEGTSKDLTDILDSKEIAIVFTPQGNGLNYGITKLFCLSNGTWEKIEVRKNIMELDTVYSSSEIGFVFKDIVIRQECRVKESTTFLRKLINHGLFELTEESVLLKKCDPNAIIKRKDAGAVVFQIIKGNQVRKLRYTYPWYRIKDCPNVTEWNNILAIKNLFEDEWYAKEH